MRVYVVPKVFPGWSAATTLVKEHGFAAAGHAGDAIKAPDLSGRLDASVRALASFDHAIDNVDKLPVKWFVPNMGKYLTGYAAAKHAVTLLVSSGLIPHARERVGRQMIGAALDTFHAGLEAATTDASRFGRRLAQGWLDASIEDAVAGSLMLRDGDGFEQHRHLRDVRAAAGKGRPIDPTLVRRIEEIFTDAVRELDDRIAAGAPNNGLGPVGDAAYGPELAALTAQVDELLATARSAADQLARDAASIDLREVAS